MDINEDYQMTKAMTHYQCRPLVDQIARLRYEVEALRVDAEIGRMAVILRRELHDSPRSFFSQLDAAIDAARGGK